MLTCKAIIDLAGQIAKTGTFDASGNSIGYTSQARQLLNSILEHVARTIDVSAAMGTFDFTFNTTLVTAGSGNIIQAAPNPLPLDYLRVETSGGSTGAQRSSKWYLNGVPYDMVEVDLAEWDDQVQQAGTQSYPYYWAKDMSQFVLIATGSGDLSTASQVVNNVTSPDASLIGQSISANNIVPGTTVIAVGATSITLSQAPSRNETGASLLFGYPPVGLPYPPPSGAFACRIRYQRLMPPYTAAQIAAGAFPWFQDDQYLINALAAALMGLSGDTRTIEYETKADRKLASYLKMADDRANRSQTVQLDRRTFGGRYSNPNNTKQVGW